MGFLGASWKTTSAGIAQFLIIALTQGQTLLDNDPATMPDWTVVITSLIALVALWKARDNDVTSERAKAKP